MKYKLNGIKQFLASPVMRLVRAISLSVILLVISSEHNAFADVVWMNDGSIYFGTIESADSDGIKINSFGETKKILNRNISRTDKTLDQLKQLDVEILLRNGSIIKGRIQNYDEEIGVLVETELGPTTLPVSSIKQIYDPSKQKYYKGTDFTIGITGGYYIPVMGLAPDFNSSLDFSIFFEHHTQILHGLTFGGEVNTILIDYKVDDSEFSIYSIQPYVTYRFLQLRNSSSFIKYFTPFVSAGAGAAYIIREDSSTQASEIDPVINIKLGFDTTVAANFGIRIYTGIETIPQSSSTFNRVFFNAGLMYSF